MCADLGESILQWTDRLSRRISREADLFPLLKRPSGNPVKVSITNPTAEAGRRRKIMLRIQQTILYHDHIAVECEVYYLPSPPQALLGVMTTSLQLSVSVLYT